MGEEDEDDSPNDGSKSGDSASLGSVRKSLTFGSACPTTGAGVATAGVLESKAGTVLATVPAAPGRRTPVPGVHITVRSNIRGDVETVLDTFPGRHFPVTRSTTGAGGSCQLSIRAVLLV